MNKLDALNAVRDKYPEAELKTCYEAIANGNASLVEVHGFVVDDLYFVDSRMLKVYEKSQFILVENIEDELLDQLKRQTSILPFFLYYKHFGKINIQLFKHQLKRKCTQQSHLFSLFFNTLSTLTSYQKYYSFKIVFVLILYGKNMTKAPLIVDVQISSVTNTVIANTLSKHIKK